jgi:geranylgeranyl diphosphate synthase, type II
MNYEEQYAAYQMAVETALKTAVPTDIPNPLRDAMQYSLLAGGKRLRPVLLLAAYNMFIDDYSAALPFSVALEMVHTYSLIHDDLPAMDNDDFRRGHPTCHKVYGESTAVLAGDGLLSLAFEIMSQSEHPHAFQALAELAHRCGTRGMVAGQCADLSAEKEGGDSALLHYIHLHKTADLLTAPPVMGGMLAGADKHVLNEFREYGKNLGIAFQIIDDILDVVGDEKMLGKQIGKDAQEHKCTWVSLYGLDQAKRDAEKYTSLAVDSIKGRENAALFLKTLAQKALVRVQ